MDILKRDIAAGVLRSGGVLVLGTDTLPGFHCRFDSVEGLKRIIKIKGRSPDKPLLVLAAHWEQAQQVLGNMTNQQAEFCRGCWPGPFSLILPARESVPLLLTADTQTVAVRVPDFPDLREFLEGVGAPLVSTSVNAEGEAPARNMSEALLSPWPVDGAYEAGHPIVLTPPSEPVSSALVNLTSWPPQVLRQGPRDIPGDLLK